MKGRYAVVHWAPSVADGGRWYGAPMLASNRNDFDAEDLMRGPADHPATIVAVVDGGAADFAWPDVLRQSDVDLRPWVRS